MSLQKLYLRLATEAPNISGSSQQRIHRYALSHTDEELAAALARRSDTVDEIDAELGNWPSAKVQAAWFARPGRTPEQAVAKVQRERRVTVLEVVAALEGLPERIYAHCAARDSARVSMPLLTNTCVPESVRQDAARVIAGDFKRMSASRRHSMVSILATCTPPVISAFVRHTSSLDDLGSVLRTTSEIDRSAAGHVVSLCAKVVTSIPARRDQKAAATRYYASWYELNNDLRAVNDVIVALSAVHPLEQLDLSRLVDVTSAALTHVTDATPRLSEDQELARMLTTVAQTCTLTGSSVSSPTARARSASSAAELVEMLAKHGDRMVAAAALCNPHANAEVARLCVRAMSWHDPVRLLEARSKEMGVDVKAVIMSRSHVFEDVAFRSFAAPGDPRELWLATVKEHTSQDGSRSLGRLLTSSLAGPDVIPMLPLKAFTDDTIPGWAHAALLEYLEANLTSQASWDGFEVLAPKHLGDVATIVRASVRTARPPSS
jgi:hypothetical protein